MCSLKISANLNQTMHFASQVRFRSGLGKIKCNWVLDMYKLAVDIGSFYSWPVALI